MRRIVIFAFLMLFVFSCCAFAETDSVNLYVNGVRIVMLGEEDAVERPLVQDGKLYVPLKSFVESIGGIYEYDEDSSRVNIRFDNSQQNSYHETEKVAVTCENFDYYFDVECSLSGFKEVNNGEENPLLNFSDYSGSIDFKIIPKKDLTVDDVNFTYVIEFNNLYKYTVRGKLDEKGYFSAKEKYTISEGLPKYKFNFEPSSDVSKVSGYVIVSE